jgi:phosphatidylethanolamine/phosphatidyl-N-methylethanolamine N-methyltransferase
VSNDLAKRSTATAARLTMKMRIKSAAIKSRFADQMHFVGALVQSPRQTGAIAPTSSDLAAMMASYLRLDSDLPVLELGPGTGAITRALLDRGLAPSRLTAVEYDARFCVALSRQFPGVNVIGGDAFALRDLQGRLAPPYDCIVSGLPLLNFAEEDRRRLLKSALDLLAPGRPFVQFTYGVRPPITMNDPAIEISRSHWVLRNLPPARIWTYRRQLDA